MQEQSACGFPAAMCLALTVPDNARYAKHHRLQHPLDLIEQPYPSSTIAFHDWRDSYHWLQFVLDQLLKESQNHQDTYRKNIHHVPVLVSQKSTLLSEDIYSFHSYYDTVFGRLSEKDAPIVLQQRFLLLPSQFLPLQDNDRHHVQNDP